ncbi:hypothetical protein CEP51_016836 [Fusarium floridanum]|uniref:Uncharacterized protein n=1 Tax=Fusarium floridanum TaxID=1325733 RepID=A0A428NEI9_9HYPO|nr:hypothetical protein CEP51_016836 [Fusarium floridanum]
MKLFPTLVWRPTALAWSELRRSGSPSLYTTLALTIARSTTLYQSPSWRKKCIRTNYLPSCSLLLRSLTNRLRPRQRQQLFPEQVNKQKTNHLLAANLHTIQ